MNLSQTRFFAPASEDYVFFSNNACGVVSSRLWLPLMTLIIRYLTCPWEPWVYDLVMMGFWGWRVKCRWALDKGPVRLQNTLQCV